MNNIVKVFHGTSMDNFKKIRESNKLIPNAGNGVGSWNPGHVYLGTNYGVASAHGYGASPTMEWGGGEPYVILEFTIDESKLKNDPDNSDECKTWKESQIKNGQVSVFGEIDLPTDTIVHYIGGECWDTKMSIPISESENFYENHKEELYVPEEED